MTWSEPEWWIFLHAGKVTYVAGAIASIVDADVAGVDTSRTPDIRASSLSHDCCAGLLEDVWQTAGLKDNINIIN